MLKELNCYFYRAELIRVVDGDTVIANVDLGFHTWRKTTVRLDRINCPEPRGKTKEAGDRATEFVRSTLPTSFFLSSTKLDSFGRSIGEIFYEKDGKIINQNELIVENNHAVYQKY